MKNSTTFKIEKLQNQYSNNGAFENSESGKKLHDFHKKISQAKTTGEIVEQHDKATADYQKMKSEKGLVAAMLTRKDVAGTVAVLHKSSTPDVEKLRSLPKTTALKSVLNPSEHYNLDLHQEIREHYPTSASSEVSMAAAKKKIEAK